MNHSKSRTARRIGGRRILLLILIMSGIAAGVAAMALVGLYRTAFQVQRGRLVETAQSHARLIEAVARFDAQFSSEHIPGGPFAAALSQITDAHERFQGFGETGEFTLARREGDQIVFLLSHRHHDLQNPHPVAFASEEAEPMRRALSGESGTVTGLDYRGERVLAAYEPVAVLDLGLVAKIDLAEIRAPFVRTGLSVIGGALILIAAGIFLFRRIGEPLVLRLERSEHKFRSLFENSRDAIYITSRSGEFVDANQATLDLLGLSRADLDRVSASDLYVDPHAREWFQDVVEQAGSVRDFEVKLRRHDGTELDCLLTATARRGADGTVDGYEGIVRDVTESKQLEERLHKTSETLRAIIDASPLAISAVDRAGNATLWSASAQRLFGWSEEEVLGHPLPQLSEQDQAEVHQLMEQDKPATGQDLGRRRRDGSWIDADGWASPLHDASGQVTGMVGIVADITERKRAERVLRLTQFAVDHAVDVVLWVQPDARFAYTNDTACRVLGYSRSELLTMSVFDVNPAMSQERWSDIWEQLRQSGSLLVKTRHRRKNGETFPVEIAANYLVHEGQEYSIAFARDISERERAEEALRESESRFRAVAESAVDAIVIADSHGNIVYWNRAAERTFGYTEQEVIGSPITRLMPERYVERHRKGFERFLLTGELAVIGKAVEFTGLRRDGSEFPVEIALASWVAGGVPFFSAVIRDITDRKAAEQGLRQSEARLAEAQAIAHVGSWDWDLGTGRLVWSDELFRILGFTPQEFEPTYERFLELAHLEDRATVEQAVEATLSLGAEYDIEFRFVRRDGTLSWIHSRAALTADDAGRPIRLAGTAQDITGRRLADQALRESEAKNRALLTAIPDMMFHLSAEGTYLDFMPAADFEPYVPPEQFLGKRVRDVMPTALAERTMKDVSRTLKTGTMQFHEYDLPAGEETKSYEYRMVPCGEDEVLAIVREITEHKQAEEALQTSERRFRELAESVPDVFFAMDSDFRYTYWNQASEALTGISAADALGRSLYALFPEARDTKADQLYKRVLRTRRPETVENEYEIGGNKHAFELTAYPSGGGVAVLCRDITERKAADVAIRRSRERLRNLAARLHAVREEERTLIARELHDQLGQALTSIKMDLSWLTEKLPKNRKALLERAQSTISTVDSAVDTVRRMSWRLRPAILDDLGLEAAVEWQVQDLQSRTNLQCTLVSDVGELTLETVRATAVFRILQEALTNVARHAEAHQANVHLRVQDDTLTLEVRDDGKGITDEQIASSQSLGLIGMGERSGALGGRVAVRRIPEGGTAVRLTMPLSAKNT